MEGHWSPHAWQWKSSGADKPRRQQGAEFEPMLSGPISPSVWPSRPKALAGGSRESQAHTFWLRSRRPSLSRLPSGREALRLGTGVWKQRGRQRCQGSKAAQERYRSGGDDSLS
jgi:hypothetical protein